MASTYGRRLTTEDTEDTEEHGEKIKIKELIRAILSSSLLTPVSSVSSVVSLRCDG